MTTNSLPNSVLVHIFRFLDHGERTPLSVISKHFRAAATRPVLFRSFRLSIDFKHWLQHEDFLTAPEEQKQSFFIMNNLTGKKHSFPLPPLEISHHQKLITAYHAGILDDTQNSPQFPPTSWYGAISLQIHWSAVSSNLEQGLTLFQNILDKGLSHPFIQSLVLDIQFPEPLDHSRWNTGLSFQSLQHLCISSIDFLVLLEPDITPNLGFIELTNMKMNELTPLNNLLEKREEAIERRDCVPLIVLDIWQCRWNDVDVLRIPRTVEILRVFQATNRNVLPVKFDHCRSLRLVAVDVDRAMNERIFVSQIMSLMEVLDHRLRMVWEMGWKAFGNESAFEALTRYEEIPIHVHFYFAKYGRLDDALLIQMAQSVAEVHSGLPVYMTLDESDHFEEIKKFCSLKRLDGCIDCLNLGIELEDF